jgi:hypothetical protein
VLLSLHVNKYSLHYYYYYYYYLKTEPRQRNWCIDQATGTRSGVQIPAGTRDFSLHQNAQPVLGGFFAGCKVAGNVALTSRLSSAELVNEWSYAFPLTICLGVDRDKRILFFFFNLVEFMPVKWEFWFRSHTGIVLCGLLVSNVIYS